MRSFQTLVVLVILCFGFNLQATDHLVLLHVNDMHGQLLPRKSDESSSGGMAGLSQIVSSVRAEVGAENVLLLDAGDWFQGTPEGASDGGLHVIRAMECLQFDATTLGNHDFDYGIDNLLSLIEATSIPIIASNVTESSGRLEKVVLRDHIIERGGFKVGLIGILTPDAPNIIAPEVGKKLQVAPLARAVRAARDRLRKQGADLLVVLSHSGVELERALAGQVEGIDLIVGGHSHTLVDPPWRDAVHGTVVAQVGAKTRHVGRIEFSRQQNIVSVSASVIAVQAISEAADPKLASLLASVSASVGEKMNRKVGESPVTLHRGGHNDNGAVSSPLGRWICDSMAEATGVDASFHNHGGIRDDLPAGEVLYRDLFEISPFGNRVTVLTLTGKELKQVVVRSLTTEGRGVDFHGVRVQVAEADGGPIEVEQILLQGVPIDDEQQLRIATNDYLATGGDGWDLLAAAPREDGGMSVLEATERALVMVDSADRIFASIDEEVYLPTPDRGGEGAPWLDRARSLLGLLVLVVLCWAVSSRRNEVRWRTVYWGLGLQLVLAVVILRTEWGTSFTSGAKEIFQGILDFSEAGTGMVFGTLSSASGAGFQLWIVLLGTIIFVSTLMAIFYHIGLLQIVVWLIARVMQMTMKTSGPESLAAAANIFAGQTEAPLVIRPYLKTMSNSEVMALMTGGMATVAGSVFAAYVSLGIDAGHLLAASFMSAPAALVAAKLMVPEKRDRGDPTAAKLEINRTDSNLLDAACRGTSEGLTLALNVIAMLIAFVAIVALANASLAWLTQHISYWALCLVDLVRPGEIAVLTESPYFNLQDLFGWIFYPFAWLLGVDFKDVPAVASLIGMKTVLNEFVAFLKLSDIDTLSERSRAITTYALCGFANFASVAIQIGGISSLEPSLRPRLSSLGLRALVGGTIAALMTGCVAGIVLP
ncbi:MAG: 5'-nucleotidase C-terminal domain-containing protein [Planctomycetota bacterium]|nr:5'-nucleotidase C-terminal domain-containing protein [Planctomycetota bacterium]